jgi:hypothetical protein
MKFENVTFLLIMAAKQHNNKRLKTSDFFNPDSISQCSFTNYVLELDQTKNLQH